MSLDHLSELDQIAEESSVYLWQRDFDVTPAAIRAYAQAEGLDPDAFFEQLLDARETDEDEDDDIFDTYRRETERYELEEIFEACVTQEDFDLLSAMTDFKTEVLTEQRPPE